MELPQDLLAAIDHEVAPLSAKRLALAASELSSRYRTGQPARGAARQGSFLQSVEDVAAYAAFRLPATFAAVYGALRQVQEGLPGWAPQTLLDVGAGPGTALWAAAAVWPESLAEATLLDRDEGMMALGRRLAGHSGQPVVRQAVWQQADLLGQWAAAPHDLVLAAYVLNELPREEGLRLVRRLWAVTGHTLVLVEPGTPAGFQRIREVREQLVAAGGFTVAPCPHNGACPMAGSDWCHFSQRVSRSRLHRQIKSGELSYEDEKFSFIGISRQAGAAVTGRVIRHPQPRSGHIYLDVCTPAGVRREVISRKDGELFRQARSLQWGSSLGQT